jgi:hypothetical protein
MRFLSWLFGCSHSNLSFPITIKKRTYRVCTDCGKEFEFSWEKMGGTR